MSLEDLIEYIADTQNAFAVDNSNSNVPVDYHVYRVDGQTILADLWPLEAFVVDTAHLGADEALKLLEVFIVDEGNDNADSSENT